VRVRVQRQLVARDLQLAVRTADNAEEAGDAGDATRSGGQAAAQLPVQRTLPPTFFSTFQ
jgi:hypothetical protein